MSMPRTRYLIIALLLPAGLWLAWPTATQPDRKAPAEDRPTRKMAGAAYQDFSAPGVRSPRRALEKVQTHPRIEAVLADDSIGVHEAAVMLHGLAVDESLAVSDRLDALSHGLMLDFAPYARFAETPDLPTPLANEYLDAVMNHNESPKEQILAYLALLNHKNPDVVASAAEMLAFMVEDDFNEAGSAELIGMAEKKLIELSQEAQGEAR